MAEDRVYFAVGVDGEARGYIKVGVSKRPRRRMMRIGRGWSGPDGRFELIGHVPGSYDLERQIHRTFAGIGARAQYGREYFFAPRVIAHVDRLLVRLGDRDTYRSSLLEPLRPAVPELAEHYRVRRLGIEVAMARARLVSLFGHRGVVA